MNQQATIEIAKDFGAHITSHPENKHTPVAAMNRDGLPGVWLIYPDASKKAPVAKPVTIDSPIETAPRGNWPFK